MLHSHGGIIHGGSVEWYLHIGTKLYVSCVAFDDTCSVEWYYPDKLHTRWQCTSREVRLPAQVLITHRWGHSGILLQTQHFGTDPQNPNKLPICTEPTALIYLLKSKNKLIRSSWVLEMLTVCCSQVIFILSLPGYMLMEFCGFSQFIRANPGVKISNWPYLPSSTVLSVGPRNIYWLSEAKCMEIRTRDQPWVVQSTVHHVD
jgi:hypothetical protein